MELGQLRRKVLISTSRRAALGFVLGCAVSLVMWGDGKPAPGAVSSPAAVYTQLVGPSDTAIRRLQADVAANAALPRLHDDAKAWLAADSTLRTQLTAQQWPTAVRSWIVAMTDTQLVQEELLARKLQGSVSTAEFAAECSEARIENDAATVRALLQAGS